MDTLSRVFNLKRFAALLVPMVLLFFLQACSGDKHEDEDIPGMAEDMLEESYLPAKKDSKDITITIVPKSLDNPIFLDTKEAAERKCREIGVRFEWVAPYQADEKEQELIIESLIRRKVDGIAISCINPARIRKVIDKAIEAGIKVCTFDSDSPDSKRLFYCGTNNYEVGAACAQALKNVLEQKNKSRDTLKTFVMTGNADSYNLRERLRGFEDVCKKEGLKLEYTDVLYCNDDISKAGELLEKYIRQNYSTDVFFSVGGWPLIVPSDSLPDFNRWCNDKGTSIVVDTSYPILVSAKKGMADALVGQDFSKMGELSVEYLYRAIKGEKTDLHFIDTGLELADKNNYDLLLQTKKPWDIK